MKFLYKLASEHSPDANSNAALASLSGWGGSLAGLTGGAAANYYSVKFLTKNPQQDMVNVDDTLVKSDRERTKQRKRMDSLAKPHGYVRKSPDSDFWVDTTGKNRPNIKFDSRLYDTEVGPHMLSGTGSLANRITLGGTKSMRKKNILAHELGHALQPRKIFPYYEAATALSVLGTLGNAALSGVVRNEENKDTLDKVQKGVLGASLAAGAIPVAIEADASWRGSKGLATAKTRWGRIKQRANAFRGVPSYASFLIGMPLASYYGGKAARKLVNSKGDAESDD